MCWVMHMMTFTIYASTSHVLNAYLSYLMCEVSCLKRSLAAPFVVFSFLFSESLLTSWLLSLGHHCQRLHGQVSVQCTVRLDCPANQPFSTQQERFGGVCPGTGPVKIILYMCIYKIVFAHTHTFFWVI